MSDSLFFFTWVVFVMGGVAIILTAMLRRQRMFEMAHRERMAMIERGMVPPVAPHNPAALGYGRLHDRDTRSRLMSGGIVVIAFGLGLMMIIGIAGDSPETAVGVGGAVAVLGAAFVVIAMVQRNAPMPPLPAPSSPFSPPPYPPPPAPPPGNHTDR